MQNKFGIRALALVLAMVMVFGLMPAAASAAPAKSAATGYKTIAEYLAERKTTFDRIDPNAEVEFIVELEEAPLADSLPAGMKLADFLDTAKGSVQANTIEQQQAVMAAKIEAAADVTISHRYQVVLNGFAVKGRLTDRAALERLEGVKRVTLGNVYNVPETQAAEGELITSGEMIHSDSVNDEGYTGKGTFAAILDTGLNVSHEAFIGEKVQGAVITEGTISALTGLTADGDLYKNAKVAFAYDYADGDDDVSDAQGHGTHVAGTVGANGETFVGVAPDAQLAIMKVFGDQGGAYDSDIFAALEDCVILGVDTVNMSLGTSCGFTYENDATEAVYASVRSAGINLMVSAGNDYDSAFQNLHGTDLPLASNPDYGIVGSPSTYAQSLSVASVNEALAYAAYFLVGDTRISYDENPETALPFAELNGDYEYVRVTGVGNVNDFAKVDVTGKVALVERGEIAFTEKEQNAYDAGAVAMIVYNNSDAEETVYMQLNGLIPAVFISKAEGKLMKDAANKVITASTEFAGRMASPVAGEMSDFSSLGVAPDMSLKPEITAPGGNVWSTSASGGYEEMSGTSMAAPHMTGAAAVMQQYVNEAFPTLTKTEKQELIENLVMSTAVPVMDPNGVAYTPRKQGAGLANISAAVHSGAYLTVEGGRPKAELGESEEGSYAFTFTVHNVSDVAKTWNVSIDPIAAQTETLYGQDYISALCRAMAADELEVTFSAETVTVQPGETVDVTVTIALTEKSKQALSVFPNGIYVEGFIRLTGDDVTALGLPYLGFYGDWADAPIFDSTMYDDEPAFMAESAMTMMDYNGSGNYLGQNAITGNAKAEWISYASRSAEYYLVTPMQGLLRAPKEIWYTAASDEAPEDKVYVMAYENTFKSFYYASGGFVYTDFIPWEDSWQPIGGNDEEGYYYLPDGPYTFTIEARIDGESEYQKSSYPIYIDNEAPKVVGHTYEVIDGTPYLSVQVTDNHYVMAAQLVDENYTKALSPIMAIEEDSLGAVTTLVFDLTEVQEDGYKLCRLDLFDYAWNESLSDVISTTSQDIQPQSVVINEYTVTANVDSSNMEMHAFIDPANAVNKALTWSSTDESVAQVVSVSEDTLTAEIDFVGPGSCEIRATASNGVYGSASVTVNKPAASAWPSDNVIREDGYYTIPEDLNTTVTITDNAYNVTLTGAEGNTAADPYVNLTLKSQNAGLNLTIENLHLKNSANWSYNSGIVFTGENNTLTLVGENSVAQSDYGSNASISVPTGVELTIKGSGKLTMVGNCNTYGASIGGDAGQGAGTIVIDGGHFVFDSVNQGAGIGGGSNAAAADITINGGIFEMDVPREQMGYMMNTTYTGACIGSGNAAGSSSGTTKITINGGTFTGVTGTGSALIGTGYGSASNLLIEINDGSFDLTTVDEEPNGSTGGACIGTGQVGYSGTPTADITINGGEINVTSNSDGAAIGGGPGVNTGSIYIFGGTITATATAAGDAIGAGVAPGGSTNNIRISGGTVKALSTGTGKAFGDETLVNDDSDAVFLVNLEAPNVTSVTVDGKDWGIKANHPGDDLLYLYLTASAADHEVVIDGTTYLVTVTPSGDVSVKEPVTVDLSALADAIDEAEALNEEDYTPATWAELEAALEAAKAVLEDPNATQEQVDTAVSALNAAVEALVERADFTDLLLTIEAVKALENHYTSDSWAALQAALAEAEAVAANLNATQEEVIAATRALNIARDALVALGDPTELREYVDYVRESMDRMAESVFPAGLWNEAAYALDDAISILLMADQTQNDYDVALASLRDAFEALQAYSVNGMYSDIDEGTWFYDAVDFVTRYGFMNGMDGGVFAPGANINRAQFVVILYRLAGSPEVTIDNPFKDVPAESWFTDAVLWAYQSGITTGSDASHFNPGGTLVRQNMVTFLMRFANTMGIDTTKRADLSGYTDADQILPHAQAAMEWAVAEGIISGMTQTTLGPNGLANRAQIATIIQRFVTNFLW